MRSRFRTVLFGTALILAATDTADAGTLVCVNLDFCFSPTDSVESFINPDVNDQGIDFFATSNGAGGNATLINRADVLAGLWAVTSNGDSLLINYGTVGTYLEVGADIIGQDRTGTIVNYGTVAGLAEVFTTGGYAATIINYGSINRANSKTNSGGDATLSNYGVIDFDSFAVTTINGDALLFNRGTFGRDVFAAALDGGDASILNYGDIARDAEARTALAGGNAILANYGSIAGNASAHTEQVGDASLTNYDYIGDDATAYTNGSGDATLTNYGRMAGDATAQALNAGSAVLTNYGIISGNAYSYSYDTGLGTASAANYGSMYSIDVYAANGRASLVNRGQITAWADVFADSGPAKLTNYGTIGGLIPTSIQFDSPSSVTLTSYLGSRVLGAINLDRTGQNPAKDVNFRGGNWDFTFTNFTGATVDTAGAPYVVVGDRVIVVDPSAFAAERAALGGVTNAVSGLVANRLGASGGAGGGADLALPGGAEPAGGWNVWAQGFGGRANVAADGTIVASQNPFGGGAAGFDTDFGDGRFGLYGGGAAVTSGNAEAQTVSTAYGFGGAYGRYAMGRAFVALNVFGGWGSSESSRVIANNNLPTGGETASASYASRFLSPEITVGMDVDAEYGIVVTPATKLRYLADWSDGYTETGSSSNMTVGNRFFDAFEGRIELAMRQKVSAGAGSVTWSAHLGLVGTTGDAGTVNATLVGQNLAFGAPGGASTGGYYGGMNFDYALNSSLALYTGFEGTGWFDGNSDINGRAGMRVRF